MVHILSLSITRGEKLESVYDAWYKSWFFPFLFVAQIPFKILVVSADRDVAWCDKWVFLLLVVKILSLSIICGAVLESFHYAWYNLCQRGPRRRFVRKVSLSITRGTNHESFYYAWYKSWILLLLFVAQTPFEIFFVSAEREATSSEKWALLLLVV